MTLLDRELLLGRTARELVVLAGGLAITVFELVRPEGIDGPNLAVYVLATALFAARFYAARAAAVATCVGALAQQWPHLRAGEVTWETLGLLPLAGIAVLASADLVARFERAPSRVRWLPNLWADFSAAETRTLRLSAYAAGALAGLLDHIAEQLRFTPDAAAWPRPCMLALSLALALLCAGRAVGLLVVWLASLTALVLLAPRLHASESVLAAMGLPALADPGLSLPASLVTAVHYLLPAAVLAALALALTTPSALRLLRRTLFG